MSFVGLLAKWLGQKTGHVASRQSSLRSVCSIGLLFLVFDGSSASAVDFMLDYGVEAGSASDEGAVVCGTSCVVEIKSLGVKLQVSVSDSRGNIRISRADQRSGIRDCCLSRELVFQDNERTAPIRINGDITRLPIFSHASGTGQLEKRGVLYVRLGDMELPPSSGNRRRPIERGPFWTSDRLLGL